MIVLGVKGSGHDTGAAIINDENGSLQIVAISEERLNRSKHSRQYPLMSIDYCLRAFGLRSLDEVDVVAFDKHNGSLEKQARGRTPYAGTDHRPSLNYAAHSHLKFGNAKRVGIHHLLAHAASTYYHSPFEEAAILVVDAGLGIFSGKGIEIFSHDIMGYGPTLEDGKQTHRQLVLGTGMLFNAVTEHLGYGPFGPGKTMALASYGHLYERQNILPLPPTRLYRLRIVGASFAQRVASLRWQNRPQGGRGSTRCAVGESRPPNAGPARRRHGVSSRPSDEAHRIGKPVSCRRRRALVCDQSPCVR
jgi:carbamoyltransferase